MSVPCELGCITVIGDTKEYWAVDESGNPEYVTESLDTEFTNWHFCERCRTYFDSWEHAKGHVESQ